MSHASGNGGVVSQSVGGVDKDKLNTTQRDIKLIVVVPNDSWIGENIHLNYAFRLFTETIRTSRLASIMLLILSIHLQIVKWAAHKDPTTTVCR